MRAPRNVRLFNQLSLKLLPRVCISFKFVQYYSRIIFGTIRLFCALEINIYAEHSCLSIKEIVAFLHSTKPVYTLEKTEYILVKDEEKRAFFSGFVYMC